MAKPEAMSTVPATAPTTGADRDETEAGWQFFAIAGLLLALYVVVAISWR